MSNSKPHCAPRPSVSKPQSAHIDDLAAEFIPDELRDARRWIVWKWEWKPPKWDKPPIDPETGIEWDATDPANWTTFQDSRARSPKHGDGSGFTLGTEDDPSGHVILDIDHCIDDLGVISDPAQDLVKRFNSYTERTPSGHGLRIWLRGVKPGDRCKCPSHADKFLATVEIYSHGRYLTVTGRHLAGTPTAIATREAPLAELYGAMFVPPANHQGNGKPIVSGHVDATDEELIALAKKSKHGEKFAALFEQGDTSGNNNDDSSADLALMNRLAFWTICDTTRMERIFSASALARRDKWKDRPDYRARTIDKAIRDCTATYQPTWYKWPVSWWPNAPTNGQATNGAPTPTPEPDKVYESHDDPHRLGRIFLKAREVDDKPAIVYHKGEFHVWEGSAYRPLPDHEVNASTTRVAKREFDRINPIEVKEWRDRGCKDRRGVVCPPPTVRKVGTRLIGDIAQALRGETILASSIDPPAWLIDRPPFPATDVLPTANALVHLPSFVGGKAGAIVRPTPEFFCPYALDYGFDPNAPPPLEWGKFLCSVWPGETESPDALQEWMGYLLTLDTSHQKIAALIGPPRSGRGTISRVTSKLVGAGNVANPTFSGLASHFGAAGLIGKPVAIVGDARQSRRSDWAVALERLLMISGEDAIEIDRKNKPAWTGRLPTRLMLISNELPQFLDQAGALAARFLLFRFTESFLGKEDKTLDAKLQAEMPGILLWAIAGWERLRARGHFLQPKSGQDLVDQFRDLASPVGVFVRERCDVGPGNTIPRSELFQAWKDWCVQMNREPGSDDAFGRNLRTVCPNLGATQPRDKQGKKYRAYEGIGLKLAAPY